MIDTSLKSKKLDDNTILHFVEHTNDPVAITKVASQRYSNKKSYTTTWHPDFRAMYPLVDQMRNKNFAHKESAGDAASHVYHKYASMTASHEDSLKDPLSAEFVAQVERKVKSEYDPDPAPTKFNAYSLKNDDGEHIAFLNINPVYEHHVGVAGDKFSSLHASHLQFTDPEVKKSATYVAATKKFPSMDPISLMSRAKYYHENKGRQPNFTGKWRDSSNKHSHKVFGTPLTPENASAEYEKHVRSNKNYEGHSIVRHSPTMFTMHKVAASVYHTGENHIVDSSTPGELHHSMMRYEPPRDYEPKHLNEIIE
jgi:hypothetical protein